MHKEEIKYQIVVSNIEYQIKVKKPNIKLLKTEYQIVNIKYQITKNQMPNGKKSIKYQMLFLKKMAYHNHLLTKSHTLDISK